MSHLLNLADHLLQVLEHLDGPLTWLYQSIEQLYYRIRQSLQPAPSASDPWPDDSTSTLWDPDEFRPPPGPPTSMPSPPRHYPGPHTMSSRSADVIDAPAALDLSARRVSSDAHTQTDTPWAAPERGRSLLSQVTATRASQLAFNPQRTATLNWNSSNPRSTKTTPTAPSLWPALPKAGDTPAQSSWLSVRSDTSDSRLKWQWSEAFCPEPEPVRRHRSSIKSATPLAHEHPSLKYCQPAPVSYEQRSVYEGPFAPQNLAQQSYPQLPSTPIPMEHPSVSRGHLAPPNSAQRPIPQLPSAPATYEQRPVYGNQFAPLCLAQPTPPNHRSSPSNHAQRSVSALPVAPTHYEQRPPHKSPAAPPNLEHASLSRGGPAPVRVEQPPAANVGFAPMVHEQRQLASNPDLPAPSTRSLEGPQGLTNRGNLCFVNCVLQALAVIPELVTAVGHRAASAPIDADARSLLGALSEVLSGIRRPGPGSPVNTDPLILVLARLQSQTQCPRLIDTEHQTQQDVAEFLTSLFQLLRPCLSVASGRYIGYIV